MRSAAFGVHIGFPGQVRGTKHLRSGLQAMGLMGEQLDAAEVARFLRRCPGLSKVTIGELLGEPSEFWLSVLTHFVDTFDFAGPHAATWIGSNAPHP